jgi:dephospho-CoA kinase
MKSKRSSCLKIGITGGIGSGKTHVCRIIQQLGYPVFYSDQEAKSIMQNDIEVIEQIKQLFGSSAYSNGELNREHLAKCAFNNPSLLAQLNNAVHPVVRKNFSIFAEKNCDKQLIFNEAAILFETGAYKNFDLNILITAPKKLRIERIMSRDNSSEEQVVSRMKNQWEDEQKIPLADYVITNDEKSDLETDIKKILQDIEQKPK